MTAADVPDLCQHLIDSLVPQGAPSDDDLATAVVGDADGGPGNHAADRVAAWTPQDAPSADWVARKAQRAHRTISDLQAQRDRLVAQADAWLAHERKRHDATVAWAESMLEVWMRAEIDADDSKRPRQSRELPSGVTVKRTGGRPRLVVDDHDALVDFLTGDPETAELATATWKVDATKVRKLVTDDGLALKGAHVEVGPDSYKVELGGDR